MFSIAPNDLDAFLFCIVLGWTVAVLKGVWQHKHRG